METRKIDFSINIQKSFDEEKDSIFLKGVLLYFVFCFFFVSVTKFSTLATQSDHHPQLSPLPEWLGFVGLLMSVWLRLTPLQI